MFSEEKLRSYGFTGDVDSSTKIRNECSRDASLFCVVPEVVVYPKNVSDVSALVKYVSSERRAGDAAISLTCRAAGTDMSGGPLTDSIVVSMMRYFNNTVSISGDTCVVQPGVFFRDLEELLASHDRIFPSYPASKDLCTIGGIVANNSAGEKTLSMGQTLDYVKEVKMVCSDGEEHTFRPISMRALERRKKNSDFESSILNRVYELIAANQTYIASAVPNVSKNAAGYFLWRVSDQVTQQYDLTKLITGSQGTLGIITEITLAVTKPHKESALVVTFLESLDDAPVIVNSLRKHSPESIESYDDHTFRIAMKFLPQLLRKMKASFFSLAFQFIPEVWMALTGGIPKLVILAEFTGDDASEVHARAARATFDIVSKGFNVRHIQSKVESMKYWTFRRESFNLLRSKVSGMRTAPFVDDIVVNPKHLPEVLPKVYAILDSYNFLYTIAGHVGDGNFHIIPLVHIGEKRLPAIIDKAMREVFQVVFSYKGSMSGEHNDGLIRTHLLENMYGKRMVTLFESVKDIFDPLHIFNPRKKVYPDKEWAFKHIEY